MYEENVMRIIRTPNDDLYYTMGGTWVDYNLMTTIPGSFSIGESNFSDHGLMGRCCAEA
jgi:succinate dehydrogenase/fumarate reductase flavoprotein subunit